MSSGQTSSSASPNDGAAASRLPPCQLLMRSKDGVEVFSLDRSSNANGAVTATAPLPERHFLIRGPTTAQAFLPDGQYVYLHQSNVGVLRCSLTEANKSSTAPAAAKPFLPDSQAVQTMAVSPKGTYLITWERWRGDKATSSVSSNSNKDTAEVAEGSEDQQQQQQQQQGNLKVWKAATGQLVLAVSQRNLKRESWPYFQWTHDEQFVFLLTTNELRVYRGTDLQQACETSAGEDTAAATNNIRYVDKIRCPGITSFSVPTSATTTAATSSTSPSEPSSYLLTCFCTKTKDQPAKLSLHQYPPHPSAATPSKAKATSTSYPALSSKSLQAEECSIRWSPRGDACLASLQNSVDASGESYYGSTTLLLLGRHLTNPVLVPLPNSSSSSSSSSTPTVLDVSWCPNPQTPPCFLVISGKMPTTTSLHHGGTADPLFLWGQGHRNTICWSPHGRFVALAGFGNLAGGLSFWDRNKNKPMETTPVSAPCTVGCGWSPDSRLFFTAITSPRRNVDNGIRVFRYNGMEELGSVQWNNAQYYHPDKLLQVCFVPSLAPYPDRPQTPPPRSQQQQQQQKQQQQATSTTQTPQSNHGSTDNKSSVGIAAAPTASNNSDAAPASKGRYIPPSARGRPAGTSLADRMRQERESRTSGQVVKVTTSSGSGSRGGATVRGLSTAGKTTSTIPGLAPVANNNKVPGLNPVTNKSGGGGGAKKSSSTPASKPKNTATTTTTTTTKDSSKTDNNNNNKSSNKKTTTTSTTTTESSGAVETDPEKRARKLKKTLKQIEDLKAKQQQQGGGGAVLNEDQQNKVASEAQIRKELAELGF